MSALSKKVSELFSNIRIGGTPSRGNPSFFGGGNLWVSIKDMDRQPIITRTAETISDEGAKNSNCKLVKKGSLLFSFKLTVGRVSFAGTDLYTNEAIAAFDPHEAELAGVHLEYLAMVLPLAAIGDKTKNSMGAALLNKDKILDLRVPIPPLDLQRSIATRLKAQLAEVECARQAAQAQCEFSQALIDAIYREAFAYVVPVAVPPTSDDPPLGWQWRKFTELARLESGHTPSRSRPDWWGGDVSWISLTEIRALDGRWVESTQLRTNAAGIANSAARILPGGTVCYSRTASVGFVTIMGKPMATSQDFANWVCGDALDPEFLMHALIRARQRLRELATGATHKTIYMPTLETFHICAPNIDAQRRIVRDLKQRLAEASGLRAALDAQQEELAMLPQRLLAQAFEN